MLWTEKMFGVKKPIITMLHLDPLPGDPRFHYGDTMERVVEHARADLHALQEGGVDGIMFSNEFSLPYERHMSFITPAAMARVIGELKSEIRVPYGVDCISDGQASIGGGCGREVYPRNLLRRVCWGRRLLQQRFFRSAAPQGSAAPGRSEDALFHQP